MKLIIVSITVLIINIPFGYWRENVKKYSLQWILAIHVPVVLVILERILSHLGYAWFTFPFIIIAFFTGQYLGTKIFDYLKYKKHYNVSSCLVMDCIRNCF
ncbi:MAG: hypothetical protein B6D61_03140 [Bacteroidetes bacterium 4484_249]|nr:MAG: hypothetical protein B6D61_03140 [Bacteroidetes bacterium 4484_249]